MRACAWTMMACGLGLCTSAWGNVQLTGNYSENFQSMGAAGTSLPAHWFVGGREGVDGLVDSNGNGAITGTSVQVDDGSVAAGSGAIGNYNYGATGNGSSRSLGSCATTALGHRAMEVRLDNKMGGPIMAFELRYSGKQWRVENNGGNQTLVAKFSTDGVNFINMGAAFNFDSIQDTGITGPVNGDNVRINNIGGLYVPPVPIPPDATFYIRWFDLNDQGVADHGLAIDNVSITNIQVGTGTVLVFQEGVNGYGGTSDTWIGQSVPDQDNSASASLEWDGEDAGGMNFALIRFADIFGTGPGQISPTDQITSASLIYNVTNGGNPASIHEILVDWQPPNPTTFNNFGGEPGVQADEYGPTIGSAPGGTGIQTVDVTTSLLKWQTEPSSNRGWIFRPTGGTDGVEISSSNASLALRPRLLVIVNGGEPQPRTLTVKHQPYLQLGNAPLITTGPGIGETDQIVVAWQTVETGSGITPNDYFEVEYASSAEGPYTPVQPIETLDIGEGTRVNHSVTISGLPYDTLFHYRVHHKRNPSSPVLVETYTGTFRTRKHPSSTQSFVFTAHGDSATIHSANELAQFESVNQRMTLADPAFILLLGDNVYNNGTHSEFDVRLDGSVAPINSALIRNKIEYFCMGNHDANTNSGKPSLDNYYCPIVELGVTSPVAPPVGETPEKNYSFDYGLVHFTIIDSTAWGGPGASDARQSAIMAWMDADLAATQQPWKIVAAHHPIKSYFGHNDTGGGMAAEIVPILINRGVDLMLVGHSHNYQRTFPLTGYTNGSVTWNTDLSGEYAKGAQVIQVVAGTGGRNIDCCAPTSATEWLAKAFGNNNGGKVGPMIIEVTATQLVAKYTAADTGEVLDQFSIGVPGPTIKIEPATLNRTVFIGDSLPPATFTVRNRGLDTITYTLSESSPWLSVSPTSGSSTGEADEIELTFDVDELKAGLYTAEVTVTAPEAGNSPQTLTVNVTVETVRPDFDGDGDVDQSDFAFLQACLTGTGVPASPECTRADLDVPPDNDVDNSDITRFLACMKGPDTRADRTCDD